MSVKEDPTHSTRVLIDQALGYYGFSLADIVSWGGRLNVTGATDDIRRMEPLRAGTLEAIFDEGLAMTWFDAGLEHGMELIELEPDHFEYLASIGLRKANIEKGRFPHLKHDHACIDYGGWPLYAREGYSEELIYQAARSLAARAEQIVWEEPYTGPEILFTESPVAPFGTPLHAGSARFLREVLAAKKRSWTFNDGN